LKAGNQHLRKANAKCSRATEKEEVKLSLRLGSLDLKLTSTQDSFILFKGNVIHLQRINRGWKI